MFYVLVKFKNYPGPVVMGTSNLQQTPMLATMDDVEWVSPTIANGNAIAYNHPLGGQVLDGPHDHYISAYRPREEVQHQDQARLADDARRWEVPAREETDAARNKIGFGTA